MSFPDAAAFRPHSRRTFLGLATLLGVGTTLSACTKLLPPKPDAALLALLPLAARDQNIEAAAEFPYYSEFAATREQHRLALQTEITRSCGTHLNGESGDNCSAESVADLAIRAPEFATAPSSVIDIVADSRNNQTLLETLDNGSNLNSDYAAKLAIAIDGGLVLAARKAEASYEDLMPRAELVMNGVDGGKEELRAAVEAEYAAIYGLTVASAYLDQDHQKLAAAYSDMHRKVRDMAISLLSASKEEVPTPPAGYDAIDSAANLRTDTVNFLADILGATSDAWRAVIQHSRNGDSRLFALQAAGISIAQAAAMLDNSTAALPGLD